MAGKVATNDVVLALDTSADHCSVALLRDKVLVAEKSCMMQKDQSENLLNFIEQVFDEAELSLKDLRAIGVGVGPGNFTGLRIGISVAKGLAMALKIKVFGVNRFETLVESGRPTLALIKNSHDSFYTQLFIHRKPTQPPVEKTLSEILEKKYLSNTTISGDSATHISKNLKLQSGRNDSVPETVKIGLIAHKYLKNGGPPPSPLYIKGPDAKLPKEPVPLILGSDGQ